LLYTLSALLHDDTKPLYVEVSTGIPEEPKVSMS
jgi:hypothetical protein